MIEARRAQRSFGDGFITAEINDLQEPWMTHVDAMLADEVMVSVVHQALVQRHPQSRRRGRPGFPRWGGASIADPEAHPGNWRSTSSVDPKV